MAASQHGTVSLLPGGLLDGAGHVHREVELRKLTGRDEELLTTLTEAPAVLVTNILSRSLERIGDLRPVTEDLARRLLVADRLFLLVKLREATFGDRVAGTLPCPWRDCAAKVDIDFSTSDIPVTSREEPRAVYRLRLSPEAAVTGPDGELCRWITFRLPNGEDQEVVAPHLAAGGARALTLLLERCVTRAETDTDETDTDVTDTGVTDRVAPDDLVERLSPRARQEIEREMEARAPAVELEMDVQCRDCGRAFTAPFHLQDFFFGELQTSRDLLYRQVHYLAYHYHWSESEILDMPRDKRRHYIEILADEIEALNHAG